MNHKWKISVIIVIGCLSLFSIAVIAQEKGVALAKSELQLGEKARLTGDYEAALKHFRAAIDAAPDMIEAHEQFTSAMSMAEYNKLQKDPSHKDDAYMLARKQVGELYQQWAKEHLGKVLYRYFAVNYGHPAGDLATEAEYKRMIETNPKFAPAYASLASFAVMKGDDAGQREYLRKASELRPDYAMYQLQYISTFRETDPTAHLKLADDFVQRFPHDSMSYIVLVWAADCAPTPQGKIAYLQRALNAAAPAQRSYVLTSLCATYAETVPDKAAEVATKELEAGRAKASTEKSALKPLEELAAYYSNFAKARHLLALGKTVEAREISEKIQPLKLYSPDPLPLVQLRSDILTAQGKSREAYERMVTEAAPVPTAAFLNALEPLAAKVGKRPSDVRADILAASLAKATPLKDWELPDLAGGMKSTADYRGKVLYLNFWAPG